MERRAFLAGALSCLPLVAAGRQTPAGESWRDDIELLRVALSELHPGLDRYLPPVRLNRGLDRLASEFERGPSLESAYLQLSQFLASIRCGHTYANFSNQRRVIAESLFDRRTRVPFHFRWLGERMIVVRNFSGEAALSPGAEILSLNGQNPASLLRELMPYARADGNNDFKRRALLGVEGNESFETFDVFQGLLRPPSGAIHRVRVRSMPGVAIRSFELPAIGLSERRKQRPSPAVGDAAWRVEWPMPQVARLVMPTWSLYDSTWNWRAFLDETFRELRERAATLVIDIRGNEGGTDECGRMLLSHLVASPMQPDTVIRKLRYRRVPERLNSFLDTWDDSFRDWGEAVKPLPEGGFEMVSAGSGMQGVIVPREPRFMGQVFVLIDSANSSATFNFARLVQENRLGRLAGEPTGGNKRGLNGGAFFFLRLPRSGLEVDIPLIGYFPRTPQRDEGLFPDIEAIPTIPDLRSGTDRALGIALANAN